MLSHANNAELLTLANKNLHQVKVILSQLRESKQLPNQETQTKVIQLLIESIPLLKSPDEVTYIYTIQQLYRLVVTGELGFAKTPDILRPFLKKENLYKIETALQRADSIFANKNTGTTLNQDIKITNFRLLLDNATGYGNQAASLNVIIKLRALGFTGKAELIYPKSAAAKLESLFALPFGKLTKNPRYFYKKSTIFFLELNTFLAVNRQNQSASLYLGLTGALDSNSPADYLKLNAGLSNTTEILSNELSQKNFANFLNVKTFIKLSPYHTYSNADTIIYQKDLPFPITQINSRYQFLNIPIAHVDHMQHELKSTSQGKKFIAHHPGFQQLLIHLRNQTINYFPVYGRSMKENPANLVNFALGARAVQLRGSDVFQKPVMMLVFHSANKPMLEYLSHAKKSNIIVLDSFESLLHADLEANHVYLLFTDPLPKNIFEVLYTYDGSNVWPPVREGASAFTSLLTKDKPHLYCRFNQNWELLALADRNLKPLLETISNHACQKTFYEPNQETITLIADYIITAKNNQSLLAKEFEKLHKQAIEPANDRILSALNVAMKLAPLTLAETQRKLSAYLYQGFYIDSIKAAKTSLLPEEKVTSVLTNISCQARTKSSYDFFSSIFTCIANNITKNILNSINELQRCETYFPRSQPNLWNSSLTFFQAKDVSLASMIQPSVMIGHP